MKDSSPGALRCTIAPGLFLQTFMEHGRVGVSNEAAALIICLTFSRRSDGAGPGQSGYSALPMRSTHHRRSLRAGKGNGSQRRKKPFYHVADMLRRNRRIRQLQPLALALTLDVDPIAVYTEQSNSYR